MREVEPEPRKKSGLLVGIPCIFGALLGGAMGRVLLGSLGGIVGAAIVAVLFVYVTEWITDRKDRLPPPR